MHARARRVALGGIAILLTACSLISGASDLVIGDPAPPEAGPGEASSLADGPEPRDAAKDRNGESDGAAATCDEPGLVAHWRFDEPSGLAVRDCSSNRVDGLLDGGTRIGERDGGAILFDAGWVGFGNPTKLQLQGPMTVCARVRTDVYRPANSTSDVVNKRNIAMPGEGWRLGVAAQDGVTWTLLSQDLISGPIDAGVWLVACGVFNPGSRYELYIDGKVAAVGDAGGLGLITASPLEVRIGNNGDGNRPLVGAVDDVRVYERALSAAEVASLGAK